MAQLARFNLMAGGATAVMALVWAAGTGTAHAAVNPIPGVDPCHAPVPGHTSAGGGQVPPYYYGSGTPASAYEAYAQLPSRTSASGTEPVTGSAAPPGALAFTGSEPIFFGVGGVALVALGGALVGISRRRTLPEGPEHEAS